MPVSIGLFCHINRALLTHTHVGYKYIMITHWELEAAQVEREKRERMQQQRQQEMLGKAALDKAREAREAVEQLNMAMEALTDI